MDDSSFHHSERIAQMCADSGIRLVYLLLIRQTSTQLKKFSLSSSALLDVNRATTKRIWTKGFISSLIDVLLRSGQEKRVLGAIFGKQACLLEN